MICLEDADNPIHQVHATKYDDWMAAWSDEEVTLFGDGGNDHLTGRVGYDTYFFRRGDGQDSVEDREDRNQIVFKGVNQNEVMTPGLLQMPEPERLFPVRWI